ncbi:GntR family transcriptional regulator [Azorhizobium oxalatiphilum]|uniref:GntR family transcriptional regulator n=1 Tax=Azorhizobium oxalatiphilum TaxID=980631 RepID=A0A917F3Z3_9HYPH|nr:GntR family transcriptional regulator [Azorhizobium oxalatiphilum]GGF46404.1 GntR family transcriptional regulator [Azorhizobium oxalatiphilum]
MQANGASFRSLEPEEAPRSLREEAYEIIKQRIITGLFRPGEALSEAQVSSALSLGRTPVRQAFDRLMHDGLVEILPRKGIMVRPITRDEVQDMVAVRLLNEGFCARLAAERADYAVLGALNDALARGRAAAQAGDPDTLMALDRRFHGAISAAARNMVLGDILRNLHDRSQRVWFLSLREHEHHNRVVEEHAAIVDAIARRDADGAEAAMRAHILSFAENLGRQL